MSYLEVPTDHGVFQFRGRLGDKPGCPSWATDSFACHCRLAKVCYARAHQRQYPNVDKRWTQNQRILDRLEARDDRLGAQILFDTFYRWAQSKGEQYVRGWVSGSGTLWQILRVAEVATLKTWIPSEKYTQSDLGRHTKVIIRHSGEVGRYRSTIHHEEVRDGAFECPEVCEGCRACWDKSVPLISYSAKHGAERLVP